MPHHKSCKRRLKTSEKERIRNKAVKTKMKNAVKKVVNAKDKNEALENVKLAYSIIDKSVKSNVLHKNNAANKKSKLSRIVSGMK